MTRRRLASLATVMGLFLGGLVGTASPAAAAGACYYRGGGSYGADQSGYLPPIGPGLASVQPILYGLIGYADLSGGCVSGELDLVARSPAGVNTPSTPATCNVVLPAGLSSGTGCDDLLGTGGVGFVADGTPLWPEATITVTAELVAVGADGSRVVITPSPCTGELAVWIDTSFRCSI